MRKARRTTAAIDRPTRAPILRGEESRGEGLMGELKKNGRRKSYF